MSNKRCKVDPDVLEFKDIPNEVILEVILSFYELNIEYSWRNENEIAPQLEFELFGRFKKDATRRIFPVFTYVVGIRGRIKDKIVINWSTIKARIVCSLEESRKWDLGRCVELKLALYFDGLKTEPNEKFGDFVNLRTLDLTDNKIRVIKGLDKLVNLRELNLEGNQIREIKGLDKLVNLRHLDLSRNEIEEIKGLDKLVNLRDLIINGNGITGIHIIEGLDTLVELRNLSLEFNQIKKCIGLKKLVNLVDLSLAGNFIRNIDKNEIRYLVNLRSMRITENPIESLCSLHVLNITNLDGLDIIIVK